MNEEMRRLEREMVTALGEKLLREGQNLLEEIHESRGMSEPLQAALAKLRDWEDSKALVKQTLSGEA